MEKQVFKIKTETDLELSVSRAVTGDSISNVETEEIALLIYGYDPNKKPKNAEVDDFVIISKQECKRLIKVLELLSL